jgi:hypothetical protein
MEQLTCSLERTPLLLTEMSRMDKEVLMPRVAVLTFGIFPSEITESRLQSFRNVAQPVFSGAESVRGFIRLVEEKTEKASPLSRFLTADRLIGSAETLSLWTHLEPLFAFAYHGLHAEALSRRTEWFVKPEFPNHVLWWVDDQHTPDWREAYQHHEYLYENGPTPYAFNFKRPFDALGNPTQLDRDAIKRIQKSSNPSEG